MAEFLTMDEAKSKFGTKGRTNAGLTLGIIGTALAAFAGNNGGCGCGNGFTEPLHATITSDATSSTSTAEDPTYSR